jgi:hypothetical protein
MIFLIGRKKRRREENGGLEVLLYMLLTQKGGDANNVLFTVEKYSDLGRQYINRLRIGYLRNAGSDPDNDLKKNLGTVFCETAGIMFRNGAARGAEYMEGAGGIAENNRVRTQKIKNEIINSAGIVFTMVMMFMIIIYFLAPYIDFFNINNI